MAEPIKPLFGLNHTASVIGIFRRCIMRIGHGGEIRTVIPPVAALFHQTITRELLESEIQRSVVRSENASQAVMYEVAAW